MKNKVYTLEEVEKMANPVREEPCQACGESVVEFDYFNTYEGEKVLQGTCRDCGFCCGKVQEI